MLDRIQGYEAFCVAAFIFAVTPGLDTVFVLNKSIAQGMASGLGAALGVCTGILVHTVVAAAGLSALLATSAAAFLVLKWCGAAYLVWLGVQALRKSGSAHHGPSRPTPPGFWKSYASGMLTNVLNPKVALFVLAFFPQFIVHGADPALPMCVLGVTYSALGTVWYLAMAAVAASAGRAVLSGPKAGKWMDRASGAVFIGLGAKIVAE